MQSFIDFLVENERIIDLIQSVFFFVLAVMLYRKTGNINFLSEVFEEMKYRTENYQLKQSVDENGVVITTFSRDGQTFDKLFPVYRLNKVTNELEKTDEYIDIQEQIESFKEQALQSMLERFMPKIVDETADFTGVVADLDMLTESFDVAEEYREKLGLSENLSISDVYKHMQEYRDKLKDKINVEVKKGETKKNESQKE